MQNTKVEIIFWHLPRLLHNTQFSLPSCNRQSSTTTFHIASRISAISIPQKQLSQYIQIFNKAQETPVHLKLSISTSTKSVFFNTKTTFSGYISSIHVFALMQYNEFSVLKYLSNNVSTVHVLPIFSIISFLTIQTNQQVQLYLLHFQPGILSNISIISSQITKFQQIHCTNLSHTFAGSNYTLKKLR